MANSYNVRPILLNTVMGSGYQAAISAAAGNRIPVFVKSIVWVGPVTSGDTFTIIDPASSTVLFEAKAAATDVGTTKQFIINRMWGDFELSQISSGTVLVFE